MNFYQLLHPQSLIRPSFPPPLCSFFPHAPNRTSVPQYAASYMATLFPTWSAAYHHWTMVWHSKPSEGSDACCLLGFLVPTCTKEGVSRYVSGHVLRPCRLWGGAGMQVGCRCWFLGIAVRTVNNWNERTWELTSGCSVDPVSGICVSWGLGRRLELVKVYGVHIDSCDQLIWSGSSTMEFSLLSDLNPVRHKLTTLLDLNFHFTSSCVNLYTSAAETGGSKVWPGPESLDLLQKEPLTRPFLLQKLSNEFIEDRVTVLVRCCLKL